MPECVCKLDKFINTLPNNTLRYSCHNDGVLHSMAAVPLSNHLLRVAVKEVSDYNSVSFILYVWSSNVVTHIYNLYAGWELFILGPIIFGFQNNLIFLSIEWDILEIPNLNTRSIYIPYKGYTRTLIFLCIILSEIFVKPGLITRFQDILFFYCRYRLNIDYPTSKDYPLCRINRGFTYSNLYHSSDTFITPSNMTKG